MGNPKKKSHSSPLILRVLSRFLGSARRLRLNLPQKLRGEMTKHAHLYPEVLIDRKSRTGKHGDNPLTVLQMLLRSTVDTVESTFVTVNHSLASTLLTATGNNATACKEVTIDVMITPTANGNGLIAMKEIVHEITPI
jgi:hypothetical protein